MKKLLLRFFVPAVIQGTLLSSCSIVALDTKGKMDANFRPGARMASTSSSSSSSAAPDLIDDDNSSSGFAGGTKVGVTWNTNKIILGPDTDCDGNMSEGETTYSNCAELDSSWTPQWASLQGYWKLNESSWNGTAGEAVDSKNTHHGQAIGGATVTTSAKMGSHAGVFDGTNDYVTGAMVGSYTEYTIMAWIKLSTSTDWGGIWQPDNYNGIARMNGNTRKLDFSDLVGASTLSLNQWYHATFIYDGTKRYIYLNGIKDAEDTPAGYTLTFNNFEIGRNEQSNSYLFQGNLDEVAVWDKALTAAEVESIYSRQTMKYSGSLTSRVMNYGSSISWDGLKWLSTLPFGKELTGDANNSGTITSDDSESSSDYSALVGSSGSTSDNDLMTGLGALWHMNESSWGDVANEVVDASGNGLHGRAKGFPTTLINGYLGRGAIFDGTDDYIAAPTIPALNSGTEFTISIWARIDRLTAWDGLACQQSGANNRVWFGLGGSSTRPAIGVANGANTYAESTSDVITQGEWAHWIARYDGSQATDAEKLKIYINGVELTLAYNGGAVPATTNTLGATFVLGQHCVSSAYKGEMDEVAIWSRALHTDEIKQLYRRGSNRIKYQVRTCSAADCSDNATWLGSDNSNGSYFSELHNYAPYNFDTNNCAAANLILTGSPSLLYSCFTGALSNLTSQRYFQYRAILESNDASTQCNYGSGATWCSPELKSVEAKP